MYTVLLLMIGERDWCIYSFRVYAADFMFKIMFYPQMDVISPLLVTLDSAHLIAAAHSLQASPPPERTTPFVAGVRAGL